MNNKEQIEKFNTALKVFDRWVMTIGLPNNVKPLKDITSQEYKRALYNFYKSLNIEEQISFREWIESFYSKNEIDYDYIDLMSWNNWFQLYLKIMIKYIQEGVINCEI